MKVFKQQKSKTQSRFTLSLISTLVLVCTPVHANIRDTSSGSNIRIAPPTGPSSATTNNVNQINIGNTGNNGSRNGIAIGKGAYIEDMGSHTEEGIAIGSNAKALDGTARRKLKGASSGIAIGKSTYANESTVDIGAKSTGSEAQGANRRGVVSVGADSYAAAHFSTMTGAYSSIKTNPNVTTKGLLFGFIPVDGPAMQGFGSVSNGAFNHIKADSPDGTSGERYDGMANAITGVANTIEHSNGALIYGAGNRITNSKKDLTLDTSDIEFSNLLEPDALNKVLNKRNAEGEKPLSGSVGVFGGGNTVDFTHLSNVTGVDNTLTGTEGNESKKNSLTGFKNNATNVHDLFNTGSHNTTTNASESIVIGNYNKLSGTNVDRSDVHRNIVIGFQDKDSEKIGENIKNNQIIGSDVTVHAETTKGLLLGDGAEIAASNTDNTTALSGAVALGSESKADRQALTGVETSKDKIETAASTNTVYAMEEASNEDKKAIKDTIKGNLAAVSVGNSNKTRQIINVAAGSEDTDAANVAQLRALTNAVSNKLTDGRAFNADNANDTNTDNQKITKPLGDILSIVGGDFDFDGTSIGKGDSYKKNNIAVVAKEGKLQIGIKDAPTFEGEVTAHGFNASNQKITHVADAQDDQDAVNLRQVKELIKNVAGQSIDTNTINEIKGDIQHVDRHASSGTASALAVAGLPQAYIPGHSMAAVSVSTHRGQSAVALGVSRVGDSGHVVIKLNGVANNTGDISGTLGVGYQW